MKARTYVIGMTVLVCTVLTWYVLRTRAATAQAESQLAFLEVRLAQAQSALKAAKATAVTASAPSPVNAPAGPKTEKKAAPRPASFMDFAREDPQLMNLWIADRKALFHQLYGALFQTLHFTSAQREKFKAVLAAEAARAIDLSAAIKEQGLDFDDPAAKRLHDDSTKQRETELTALLGEKDYSTYREFERTLRVRGFVDGLAVQLAPKEPITPLQADALTQALAAASSPNPQLNDADPLSVDWPAVDRAAASILSPSQLAVWKLGLAHNPYGGSRWDIELANAVEKASVLDAHAGTKL